LLDLNDDSAGVLPQSSLKRTEAAVARLQEEDRDGFVVRCGVVGEHDAAIHFLSRVAFEPKTTPRAAHDELFTAVTGKQDVSDRLWRAFERLDQAAELISQNEQGFARAADAMLLKHAVSEPAPDWWKPVVDHHTQSMVELYRSHGGAHPGARPLLYYYAKRSEFGLGYLNAVRLVREAALARKQKNNEEAVQKLESAVEALHDAIDTLGDIAVDPSDRGLIAVLAQFAYRPLIAEYERASEAAENE
jgi:hypothetical protein